MLWPIPKPYALSHTRSKALRIRRPNSLNPPGMQVFFGGGTPSLIPPPLLGEILTALEQRYGIAADAEISMEADPGAFGPKPQSHAIMCVYLFI